MRKQLGYSHHVAQREHWCDKCSRQIFPGEIYERAVYLGDPRIVADKEAHTIRLDRKHRVIVDKRHINPVCEYPWDDEDSEEYRLEERMREEAAREEDKQDPSEVAA